MQERNENQNPAARRRLGSVAGGVAIGTNLLLSAGKLAVGALTGSVAITADGFNNLSDAASSAVTLASFRLAGKSADKEHPFGHGRSENIAGLAVAFLVLLMGVELAKSSIEKIIRPAPPLWSLPGLLLMVGAIFGKLALGLFQRGLGKKIDSATLRATSADSFSDMLATGAALLALPLGRVSSLPFDGMLGLAVSIFVLVTGIGILKATVSPLLGERPDPALVERLRARILSYEHVEGLHDLILHSYGPGRLFGSVHAEIPEELDVVTGHGIIDRMEEDIAREYGIHLVVHYDPLALHDERVTALREQAERALAGVDPRWQLHDFRVVDGAGRCNLIFDLVLPLGCADHAGAVRAAEEAIRAALPQANCVIKAEESFV